MITLPDRGVIFACTPRTGSRAVARALMCIEGAEESRLHHPFPHDVAELARMSGFEVWTVIRDPYTQLASWWHHVDTTMTREEWIANYRSRYFFYEGGMNIYGKTANRFYVYEDGGLEDLITDAGGSVEDLKVVGKSDKPPVEWTTSETFKIKSRFLYDIDLYTKIKKGKN